MGRSATKERPMPDTISHHPEIASPIGWSGELTRVPFRIYRNRTLLYTEQERVFEGRVWNFLCLLRSDAGYQDFIGAEVLARFERILGGRKIEIIGRFVEVLPKNWKCTRRTRATPTTPACCICFSSPLS
jgi:hypothetical protein